MARLELSQSGIPDFAELSEQLAANTGWRVVAVAGLVPDDAFFDHLANRRFPAGAFIRPEHELDYLEEPDIFHDVFGHVPLLANPVYADFLEAYGKGGRRALERGQLANLARLYWYTVEFGLMRRAGGLRFFGAGIMSSPAETVFSLEDSSPNRIAFDLERVMRTKYIIDDFQQTYFVIDSFEQLLADCYTGFQPDVYDRLRVGDATIIRGSELPRGCVTRREDDRAIRLPASKGRTLGWHAATLGTADSWQPTYTFVPSMRVTSPAGSERAHSEQLSSAFQQPPARWRRKSSAGARPASRCARDRRACRNGVSRATPARSPQRAAPRGRNSPRRLRRSACPVRHPPPRLETVPEPMMVPAGERACSCGMGDELPEIEGHVDARHSAGRRARR